MLVLVVLPALAVPDGAANLVTGTNPMLAVFVMLILVVGILAAMAIALRNTESRHKADVIRAVAELFRWRRR